MLDASSRARSIDGKSTPLRRLQRHPLLRIAWCALGTFVAVALALVLVSPPVSPFFFASLGGSAIFLFGLTRVPAAQPRALVGGHLACAVIGIACFQGFGDALWVYALAQVLALAFMLVTGTVHPPAGANPMLMIYSHATWAALFQPVLVGVLGLVVVAVVWSRLYPGLARYPVRWTERSPPTVSWGGWNE